MNESLKTRHPDHLKASAVFGGCKYECSDLSSDSSRTVMGMRGVKGQV